MLQLHRSLLQGLRRSRQFLAAPVPRYQHQQRYSAIRGHLAGIDVDDDQTSSAPPSPISSTTERRRKLKGKPKDDDDDDDDDDMPVLLDAEGNAVYSPPPVDPSMTMTGASNKLPLEIQRAIDEHVQATAVRNAESFLPKRHIVRHWHLDGRKTLKKSKKKALRKAHFVVTPFLMIGAYQTLLQRAERRRDCVIAKQIRDAQLDFEWFQDTANKFSDGEPHLEPSTMKKDKCKMLILHEVMAMLMRPVIAPYLPSYAWCLAEHPLPLAQLQSKVLNIARKDVPYDTRQHDFLCWDLGALTEESQGVAMDDRHIKMINNMAHPYVSQFWIHILFRLFNVYEKFTVKKLGKVWVLTEDEYSSLPAVLTDMLFLRLDYSEMLMKNSLWKHMKDLHKKNLKVDVIPGIISAEQGKKPHLDYHRLGPVVVLSYKGPQEIGEKVSRALITDIKSGMGVNKRLVRHRALSVVSPSEKRKKSYLEDLNITSAQLTAKRKKTISR